MSEHVQHPKIKHVISQYKSGFHTWNNTTQNTRACSTCKKKTKNYQSVFHMQKCITQKYQPAFHTQKIKHKIPDHIPLAARYNTKYQSAFHMRKHITQNIKVHFTCPKLATLKSSACQNMQLLKEEHNEAISAAKDTELIEKQEYI